jgi:prephenate dehydrogenase
MSTRRLVLACLVGSYLLGMGLLGGMIVSAMRFDHRRAVILRELDDTSTRVRAKLMLLEHDATRTAAQR